MLKRRLSARLLPWPGSLFSLAVHRSVSKHLVLKLKLGLGLCKLMLHVCLDPDL